MKRLAIALCALALVAAADSELARLEQERDQKPNDPSLRLALGEAYYQRARRALDTRAFPEYEIYLGKAMDEAIESVRLAPESPGPHSFMGVVAVYEGDLDGAFRSFANERRLAPRAWTSYTNIAEVLVYRGSSRFDVEKWIDRAEKLGAHSAAVELVLTLAAWRDGYMEGAERHFRRVRRLGPEMLESWNGAKVPKPLETLAELMSYCCASPACGPYLAHACQGSRLEVAKREIPEEVARRELLIEMERWRKLDEIYSQRKDLEIEVEAPEPVPSAAP